MSSPGPDSHRSVAVPDSVQGQRQTVDWRPAADLGLIRERAMMLWRIRDFMDRRGMLEVETAMLSRYGVTDPGIEALALTLRLPDRPRSLRRYLHTSPEYGMKRLLAAGSGSIYQICKVFRDNEIGCHHQPEFSMLEWYCVGADHRELMTQCVELLAELGIVDVRCRSYRQQFLEYTGLDPHTAPLAALRQRAETSSPVATGFRHRELLELLFADAVRMQGLDGCCLLYDYPECMAALARLSVTTEGYRVAQRFELYYDGVELANGYHELADAAEQRQRFHEDRTFRERSGQSLPEMDQSLLAALHQGLPDCAGVAVGLDRLLMVLAGVQEIASVQAFPCRAG